MNKKPKPAPKGVKVVNIKTAYGPEVTGILKRIDAAVATGQMSMGDALDVLKNIQKGVEDRIKSFARDLKA